MRIYSQKTSFIKNIFDEYFYKLKLTNYIIFIKVWINVKI